MGGAVASAFDKRLQFSWVTIVFIGLHVGVLAVFFVPVDVTALVMLAVLTLTRAFAITAGYHRYFAHHSFKTNRFFQFCLAFLGGSCAQKGALWWVAHHRYHHIHSDTEKDVHSPILEGFYWSHLGWIMSREYQASYDSKLVRDLTRYPELVWLDRNHFFPSALLAGLCFWFHGWAGLFWGFFLSTVIVYHATFAINSVCHLFGSRRFKTEESSRNIWWLSILTLGESWHNNHHHLPNSARHGFSWWEIDLTYYGLKILSWFGIIRNLKVASLSERTAVVVRK